MYMHLRTAESQVALQVHSSIFSIFFIGYSTKMYAHSKVVHFCAVLPRMRNLKLNAHSRAPEFAYIHASQLHISARNRCDVCSGNRPNSRKGNSKASHVKAESEHRWSKRRSNFTGAEVKVLLQDVDVSILFHNGYINAIKFSAYLFIHLHLQCSCSPFIYFRTSRCLVES